MTQRLRSILQAGSLQYVGEPWAEWVTRMFRSAVSLPDGRIVWAPFHRDVWQWAWAIDQTRPPAFFAVWPRDTGKHLELSTKIPTPSGWTTMQAIRPGDVVFDHLVAPTVVVNTSEVTSQPSLKLSFAGGGDIVASHEHRWAMIRRKQFHVLRGEAQLLWLQHATVFTTAQLLRLGAELHREWIIPAKAGPHRIERIEPVGDRLVKCLTVASPGGMFLAGEQMVPTHNSTHAELIAIYLGCEGKRRYGLYVCGTQDRADDHVQSIQSRFEAHTLEKYYPAHAERMLGKYSQSKGWRISRLRTAGGFTVDGIGLDKMTRGIRIEDNRPDFIILDDIDSHNDTSRAVLKKERQITREIIPAGNRNTCAVLFPQNLIHSNSVLSRLIRGDADFLRRRVVSGPFKALDQFTYELQGEAPDTKVVITGGKEVWPGLPLELCQQIIDDIGPTAFLREYQQEVLEGSGKLWTPELIAQHRAPPPKDVSLVAIGVDPATSDEGNAETGVIVTLFSKGHAYVMTDASGYYTPDEWARQVARYYNRYPRAIVVGEKNNGGNLVEANLRHLMPTVRYVDAWASKGKYARAEECVALYERGLVHHVGTLAQLETQMCSPYAPDAAETKWDRMDALVWTLHALFFAKSTDFHFDRTRHVVKADSEATPAYTGATQEQIRSWQLDILSGTEVHCERSEYGALRPLLLDYIARFRSQRDLRADIYERNLRMLDEAYER